jgi:uncharacterized protein
MKNLPIIIQSRNVSRKNVADCNCACSDAITDSDYFSNDSIIGVDNTDLCMQPFLQEIQLDENHRVVFVPQAKGRKSSIAVLNNVAWDMLTAFREPGCWGMHFDSWCKNWGKIVVEKMVKDLVLLQFLYDPNKDTLPDIDDKSHVLEAWLHITDRCNLRCNYCFLPHHNHDMTQEVGFETIQSIFRSAIANKYSKIKLKYAGGEAMLRFPFIVELQQYAQKLSNQYGIMLESIILSNGTNISKEIVKTMQHEKIDLMISLDGLGENHNKQRAYANGRGSFSDVVNSIDLVLSYGMSPHISITVSGQNAQGLAELLKWILKKGLFFRINFYRENDFSTNHQDLRLVDEKIIAGMDAAFKILEANLPQHSLLASLVDLADLSSPHLHTCGIGQNYMVYDYLGRISKCHMLMGHPIASMNDQDPLFAIRADRLGLQNLSVSEKIECRDCEWRYWCTGGCPLTNFRATGQYNAKSPNCSLYKSLYPRAVFLEGKRLLKWEMDQSNDKELL